MIIIESTNLDPGVIGLIESSGPRVIINSAYLDCGSKTLLYKNFCLAQLKLGHDCMVVEDGDSLRITEYPKPSMKRLRTGA